MQKNNGFWKAVHSLSHPISVIAILLLLFNDHYLRLHYPSWLTGKLGDFTWLVFAPFIAAMLFSLIFPQKARLLGLISIGFIGLWFALFKTVPFVMELTKDALEFIAGWRGSLGMDASDLLCLPALGISWTIWKNAPETSQYLRPVIYVAFALGIMGTLATSAPDGYPSVFVSKICELADGNLQVSDLISRDGGLSWQYGSASAIPLHCGDESRQSTRNFDNGTLYRWIYGERVEYSLDDGASWILLRDLYEVRQEARTILTPRLSLNDDTTTRVPAAGIVHSGTGNLVLTMGEFGILVIRENGESLWGFHLLRDLNDWASTLEILRLYFYLLLTLAFLILVTTIVLIEEGNWLWLFFGWLSWFFLLVLNYSASMNVFMNGALYLWGFIAFVSLIFIALPMSLWALYHWVRHYENATVPILVTAIVACLANFFPFLLWSQGTIPRYYVAVLFSIFLTAAVLAAFYSYFRPKLPSRYVGEKTKRKNDAV